MSRLGAEVAEEDLFAAAAAAVAVGGGRGGATRGGRVAKGRD